MISKKMNTLNALRKKSIDEALPSEFRQRNAAILDSIKMALNFNCYSKIKMDKNQLKNIDDQ